MKKKIIALFCGILSIAGTGIASADIIGGQGQSGYDVSFGAPSAVPWDADLNVKKFDPSLGTLNSIHIVLSGHNQSTSTLNNPADPPPGGPSLDWYSVSATARIKLLNPYDNSTQLLLVTPTVSNTTGGTLNDGSSINITGTGYDSVSTDLTSSSIGFSNFIGTGNVVLKTTAWGTGTTDMEMGLVFTPSGLADENLWISYDFTPATVPEPGTFFMLGAGLLGAGALVRLRRKK